MKNLSTFLERNKIEHRNYVRMNKVLARQLKSKTKRALRAFLPPTELPEET